MKLLSPSVSTKHPTSEESLHPKSFQSWRWVFLAAILLAGVTISTFYFSSAQAQANKGAITGLTLTSDAPGTLTVSWDTASPTPSDYRVDWAKSTEDYTSWKVNNGHVYAAETATTTTITDLGHDTEYKIRMRARYYRGEHEGKSWGGPWATATITVAGEPAETPNPEPSPEPTPAPGTIDTLAATDDDAGQLVLTWDPPAAPNAAPTDYHVNWAKNSEDYPADTAEAGNAHPTTTTHTLAGLEYDTDYNIRVRARYSDGENADSPWNGPWTETTAQVKLPLPAAPFIGATAVSPDGDLLLSWFNLEEDDSITGYQILRGPKADSLIVIEDDTGSSSTSYTDTAPPAGQTHTYGVKARNASGLSDLSNTLTATMPAAEEEEILIVARHESTDATLVSNLEQTVVAETAITGNTVRTKYEIANAFTTGNNGRGYHPTGVNLHLKRNTSGGVPALQVSIRENSGGEPGETSLLTFTTSTAVTLDYQLITFTTTDKVRLQPGTTYWLYVAATGGAADVRQTTSNNEDAESRADWRIGDARFTRLNEFFWTTASTGNSLRMKILGHDGLQITQSVSEPSDGDVTANVHTTGALAVDGSVTGRNTAYDVDWFAFTAEADTNYQFTANQGQKFATLNVLRIFQDDGTELRNSLIAKKDGAYHGVDRLNNIAFRTDTASTYYVSIEGWHGGGSNVPYTLAMFDDDYSDDITTTGVVDVGESFQNYVMRTGANPESSRTDDVDWIRVALKADVTYEIVYDVACLHQGRIEGIYGPDGTLLPDTTLDWPRKTKGWCTDLTTEFTPSSDDDYYIAVSAQGSHFPIGSVNPFQGVQGTLTITAK